MTRKNVKMESRCQMAAVLAGPGKLKPNCATRKGPQTASGAVLQTELRVQRCQVTLRREAEGRGSSTDLHFPPLPQRTTWIPCPEWRQDAHPERQSWRLRAEQQCGGRTVGRRKDSSSEGLRRRCSDTGEKKTKQTRLYPSEKNQR